MKLQAARLTLYRVCPYLSFAIWALRPVEKPGLGSMAVDEYWRLYFDPEAISPWAVEKVAGVIYHAINHLLREHADRARQISAEPRRFNVCADAEIDDDGLPAGLRYPAPPITPGLFGLPEHLLAEEYYNLLHQDQAQRSASEQAQRAHPAGIGNQGSASDGCAGSARPEFPGGAAGSEGEDTGGKGEARAGGEGETAGPQPPASTQPPASASQPAAPSHSASPVGDSRAGGQSGADSDPQARAQTFGPSPAAGRCGSCATGIPEHWEDPPPLEGGPEGVGRAEAELIRREVARRILEHSRSRGSVPGQLVRWAEEKLRPKVDWRRELAAAIRCAISDVAGQTDYSYRRPSRRQGVVGDGMVILPALRQPVPEIAIVVDTSGSINDKMLSQALAEVAGVLRAIGQRDGVHVLAVDAAVQSSRRVFNTSQVWLVGGGGTDMGVGISAAERLCPRPEVCIVVTDGYTPWPAQRPRGMRVIVVLLDEGGSPVPEWARVIRVEEK